MIDNSLGHLWLLNHPNSKLVEQMDYYIKPEQVGDRFYHALAIPEDIRICDPACGSGHMLTYARLICFTPSMKKKDMTQPEFQRRSSPKTFLG